MAWWKDLANIQQYSSFLQYINDDRDAVKMVNFAGCTLTTMGQDFKGRAPLQTKNRDERIVEIAIQFKGLKWFDTNAPQCKAMIEDIGVTAGRDAKEFKEKHDLAVQKGYDLRKLLISELVPTLNKVSKLIDRFWTNFINDTQGTREGAMKVVEDREKMKTEAATALRELRKHEKEKVNKHAHGNYMLYTAMLDGEPLLLISSDFKKDIDPAYLETARKYMTQHTKQSEGLYRQAGSNMTEFEQTKGNCGEGDFRDALKALRATRSAVLVAKGTIDKKKPATKGHDDQERRDALALLGELRKTHKENLKKFTSGQFWVTSAAVDGDPLIAVSKETNKPPADVAKLSSVKESDTTPEATGKWFNFDASGEVFYYEYIKGSMHANDMVNALRAARLTRVATPCPKGFEAFKKEKDEEAKRIAEAKKKKK